MRVGIVALQHESNTFLKQPTTFVDFEADLLLRGEDVRRLESSHHEVGGFFAGLLEQQIEAAPIFFARAVPKGRVSGPCYGRLMAVLGEELDRAGEIDGLLLAPHGALAAKCGDNDGTWMARLRERFGPGFPIIGTLDPHANLSSWMVENTDALIAYRTNPHIDQHMRGLEAARLMARTLRGEVRPTQAAAFPPMIINIERQRTDDAHLRAQYTFADQMRADPRVLSNSLILGFPYADVSKMGSSVVVVTNNDAELAQQLAQQWGELLWNHREQFVGKLTDIQTALEFARRNDGPICLLDMGDNIGGGSPGDSTHLAHALREAGVGPSFICLYAPAAVNAAAEVGLHRERELTVGDPPLSARFTVERLFDGRFDEPDVRHGGWQSFDMGASAVVRSDQLTILLTSKRVPPFSLRQLTSAGLDPASFRVLVAKGVHAPVAAYAPVCKHLLRVNTPGVTSADLSQFDFQRRRRPMFPFESDATWSTT